MDDTRSDVDVARRYERILAGMGDGVYILGRDLQCYDANEYLAELSGYSIDDLQGMDVARLHPPQDVAEIEAGIRDLADDPNPDVETVGATLETAGGEAVPIEVNLTQLPRPDEEFRRAIGVIRDVADRQKLERYETLLELMPDTVVITDLDGVLVDIHGFEGWSGFSKDELLGAHLSKTTPEADVAKAEDIVADLITDEDRSTATFEQEVVTKSGKRIPVENHITLLQAQDGDRVTGTMSVLRDIADRKERERELERQNERLQEFAGVVSHDLRNPLNVAIGRVELLREDVGEVEHIEEIRTALERIDAIVDDVLTLASEGEIVEEPERVSLESIAERAWSTVQPDAATLQLDDAGPIMADGDRLQRLFENLIRNAIEHGGPNVTVRVGLFDPELPVSDVGLFVADDGPGVPADERDAVFDSGYTSADDGTGFGLAIVQRIAEAHGWRVRLTEGREGGARFEFTGVTPA